MPSPTADSLCERLLTALARATVTKTEKPWGIEYAFNLEDALCKLIIVEDGERTSVQSHVEKREVTLKLTGSGGVQMYHRWDDGVISPIGTVRDGATRVNPGEIHRTFGPVVLFEIQTDHPNDVVRYADDYGRAKEDE